MLILLIAGGGVGQAQDGLDVIPLPGLGARLEALRPDDGRAYFLLAEELAEERHVREARHLAERLYVIAFEIERGAAGPAGSGGGAGSSLAESACLGLAALTPRAERRAWLRAIGQLVTAQGPGGVGPGMAAAGGANAREGVAVVPSIGPDQAALDLSTALGQMRSGDGRRAKITLERPGVRALLEGYENLLSDGAPEGAAQHVARWIEQWPQCPTCGNRRVLQRNGEGRLCSNCGGNPGPQLSSNELLAQIRAESFLLRGVYGSWAAQTLADLGEPLVDPDPARVAEAFEVDPSLRVFRAGVWRKP